MNLRYVDGFDACFPYAYWLVATTILPRISSSRYMQNMSSSVMSPSRFPGKYGQGIRKGQKSGGSIKAESFIDVESAVFGILDTDLHPCPLPLPLPLLLLPNVGSSFSLSVLKLSSISSSPSSDFPEIA